MNGEWLQSYETFLFDTPTGDLGINEYADYAFGTGENIVVREDADMNRNFVARKTSEVSITGLQKVNIVGKAYYHEFELPNGTIVRKRTTPGEYWNLSQVKPKLIL